MTTTEQPDIEPVVDPSDIGRSEFENAVIERHRRHERSRYPASCRPCRDEKVEDIHSEIDRLTCSLLDHVGTALPEVLNAQNVIQRLMSPEVYDQEFVETDDGADVYAELATAARALRNVERIGIRRREMLLAAAEA